MIIQTANILAGFALAAPKLKEVALREPIEKAHTALLPHLMVIGAVELALGVIGLLIRLDILDIYIPNLGASFPQTLPAILIGLLLLGPRFAQNPIFSNIVSTLEPHRITLGIIGIVSGLGSILFGCILCGYWRPLF